MNENPFPANNPVLKGIKVEELRDIIMAATYLEQMIQFYGGDSRYPRVREFLRTAVNDASMEIFHRKANGELVDRFEGAVTEEDRKKEQEEKNA